MLNWYQLCIIIIDPEISLSWRLRTTRQSTDFGIQKNGCGFYFNKVIELFHFVFLI